MTAGQYLFSFNGRINRAKWWLLILIQIGAAMIYYTAAVTLFATSMLSVIGTSPGAAFESAGGSGLLFLLLTIAYFVTMFAMWLAVTVKRLHDRDKSGGWIWLFALGPWAADVLAIAFAVNHSGFMAGLSALAGIAISVWAFVELGCLRGTIGDNRFGPDPLAALYLNPAQWGPVQGASAPMPVDPVRPNPPPSYPANPVQMNPAPVRSADGFAETVSARVLTSLELSGTGRFSEYYLKIDASELGGMADGLLIGRDREVCAFTIDDGAISRSHARLSMAGGDYSLEDLGSTNGTTINTRALVPHQAVRLRSGDQVGFGSALFKMRLVQDR